MDLRMIKNTSSTMLEHCWLGSRVSIDIAFKTLSSMKYLDRSRKSDEVCRFGMNFNNLPFKEQINSE